MKIRTFRVYRYYVGCHVYDVEAETPQAAHEKLEALGDAGSDFLHEANDPGENLFFTQVFEYLNSDSFDFSESPVFVSNPACAKIWSELD